VVGAAWALATPAALAAPQALVGSLQRDPVQSINVPRSSFLSLSQHQTEALKKEIASRDPGRIWILVLSPRSSSAVGNLADPLFGNLPAGTLIAVAEDRKDPNTTHWWVGSSWESSDAAQNELNNVIQGYHKGQGSFFDDLRLEVQSFAQQDAAAGHPSSGSANPRSGFTPATFTPAAGTSSSSGSKFPFAPVIVGGVFLFLFLLFGARYFRREAHSAHERHEKSADVQAKAQADFVKLGEKITALDIASSLANANPQGKDEYRHALGCYEKAERKLKDSDDEYQFQQALYAIKAGLRHVEAADQLFNAKPDPAKQVDDLARLDALHRRGALTDAEFAEQKAKLIN
jgi:hypothetical protein